MKQESSKRKTNTSVMKKVFSAVVVFALFVAVFCNSFKVEAVYQGEELTQPLNTGSYTIMTRSSPAMSLNITVNTGVCYVVCRNRTDSTFFYVMNGDNNTTQNFTLNVYDSISQGVIEYGNNQYFYYSCYQYSNAGNQTVYVPSYDSDSAAQEALVELYLNGGNGGCGETSSNSFNYSLPAGNIAYVQFNNSFDSFALQCTMPTTSYAIGSSPWPESNQYYGFASSLPSGSFTPPTTKIDWTRNGRTTLAGVTSNAVFNYGPHHPTSGNYLVIYNPAYYGGTNNGPYEFMNNGAINIQASNVVSIKVYQLDSQLTQINPGGNLDIDTTLTGVDYDGEFDEETGDIVWANGEQPIDGGGNLPTSSESGFQSFLSNLVQKIVNVFAPAQQAIQTLANAVSNFSTWMYSLYIWLPAPVLNLLTSAITLAIIIGVIKVFL